jgi:hypothetical protein
LRDFSERLTGTATEELLTCSIFELSSAISAKPRCHSTNAPYTDRHAEPEPSLANFVYSLENNSYTPYNCANAKLKHESPLELEANPDAVAKLLTLVILSFILRICSFVISTS